MMINGFIDHLNVSKFVFLVKKTSILNDVCDINSTYVAVSPF